ncbi:MAG: hypothetical protein H7X86_09150, partial [Gorillibacterium sp.]|nr:hypothetical protein [Gorillibacterium sp.]
PVTGIVEEWDPLTGDIKEVSQMLGVDGIQFTADFLPVASRLYVIRKQPTRVLSGPQSFASSEMKVGGKLQPYAVLGPTAAFTRTQPNALVLDQCRYRIQGGAWSELTDILRVQDQIRSRYDFYKGGEQRYKWIYEPHPHDGVPVELAYNLQVENVPQGPIYLVIETPEAFEILCNGTPIASLADGWYLDPSFVKISIEGLLKLGTNEIVLQCRYMNHTELESIYIIGDFAVDTARQIVKEPERLRTGDWCLQGYFHYAGSMVYHFTVHCELTAGTRFLLNLVKVHAVNVEVRVNGATVGYIPWRAANGLDLTAFLNDGENMIELELAGSPRNLLGPLHKKDQWDSWTSPSAFRPEEHLYTLDYALVPYGIMEQVYIFKQ